MTIEQDEDARADRWNDGALDGCRNRPKASADPDYLEGYADGQRSRRVRVDMPERPEGYYHCPIGTFPVDDALDPTGENIAPELLA